MGKESLSYSMWFLYWNKCLNRANIEAQSGLACVDGGKDRANRRVHGEKTD